MMTRVLRASNWHPLSEHQFQPKLNLAGTRDCAGNLARRGTDAIARKDKEVRNTEVWPVCDVKGFSPEEQAGSFRDWDGLEDREIDFGQARAIQHSAAHVSPGPQRWKAEGIRVEPLVHPADFDRSLKVWTIVGPVRIECVAIPRPVRPHQRSHRESAQERYDAIQLPAANQLVCDAVQPVAKGLTFPKGQLVTEAAASLVPKVQSGSAVVDQGMARIQHRLVVVLRLAACSSSAVVQVFRKGVIGPEEQPAAEPFCQIGLQRVITADALRVPEIRIRQIPVGPRSCREIRRSLRHQDRRIWWIWGANTTARAARRVGANLLRNRIGVNVDDVVVTVRTDIGDAKRHAAQQLLLDGVVPRDNRRSFRVELNPLRLHEGARIGYSWCTERRQR